MRPRDVNIIATIPEAGVAEGLPRSSESARRCADRGRGAQRGRPRGEGIRGVRPTTVRRREPPGGPRGGAASAGCRVPVGRWPLLARWDARAVPVLRAIRPFAPQPQAALPAAAGRLPGG